MNGSTGASFSAGAWAELSFVARTKMTPKNSDKKPIWPNGTATSRKAIECLEASFTSSKMEFVDGIREFETEMIWSRIVPGRINYCVKKSLQGRKFFDPDITE